jgi:K+-sensing histidine kinase KdpD
MIVSSHSGTIKASHNGEKGSVFTIKLPRWFNKKDFFYMFCNLILSFIDK